eukprot:CAMPEP_0181421182 /NCGR_PEP_ID=MMETSP1110-20121109/12970_1 /TAXON_ID=174948 /ORGANISM="Symbiodinium sp., Strain CCMP421" /LENGTH=86 /DNA_ID=CAMNT_0023544247 /DNA_START=248 /DNA_END=508 /DNA_ORIENTATION=-
MVNDVRRFHKVRSWKLLGHVYKNDLFLSGQGIFWQTFWKLASRVVQQMLIGLTLGTKLLCQNNSAAARDLARCEAAAVRRWMFDPA